MCDKDKRRFMFFNAGATKKIRYTLKVSHARDSDKGKVQVRNVMIHFVKSCSGIFAVHLSAHRKAFGVKMASAVYRSLSEFKACQNLS